MNFQCKARMSTLPDPQDCDWPHCGCDEHASKVLESLTEEGWTPPNQTRLGSGTDTQRFNWFFGKADKMPFLVQYCKGIAESWSVDRWRAEIDLAMTTVNPEVKP